MKKSKSHSSTRSSLRPLILFCSFVFLIIVGSLLFKLATLIKESKVDKVQTFIVSFVYNDDLDIVTISSDPKKLSHVTIKGKGSMADKKQASGILPDATLTLASAFKGPSKSSQYFFDAAFHKSDIKTTLSIYDLIRLAIAAQSIPSSDVTSELLTLPADENSQDAIAAKILEDTAIARDNKTVSIINASGVSGLGTRVGRVLSNMGISVVSVTNGDSTKNISTLEYYGEKSYTVKRIGALLTLDSKPSLKQGLSDIMLTVGKDTLKIID